MENVKKIEITVEGEEWTKTIDKAFDKKKKDLKVDGFRKGTCPKSVYMKKVGVESLFMDACDIAVEEAYKKAFEDADMEIVVEPSVSIEKVSKDGVTFTFTLIGRPEVKLGKYKKLGIKKEAVKVTKKEIEDEMEHIRGHMAEVVVKENGELVNGNTAVIDFVGTMNGEEFDGGKGEDYPLEIGSNTFIPGFEEKLIGMKAGETRDIELTFPEDYVEDLKGKDVTFKVTVKEIKERILPEYNKDFFEDLGEEGVDSEETFRKHVETKLTEAKERQEEDKYLNEVLRTATENMTVEIADEIIDSEVERMVNEYAQEMQQQGIALEQYLQLTGTKMEDLKKMMRPQAEARVKTRYLLEEIVKAEKIEATEEEADAEIKKITEQYGMTEEDFLQYAGGKDMVKYDLCMRKAVEILKES